jgi:HEAT repeat protein
MPLFGPPNIEKMKAKRDIDGLIKALDYQKEEYRDLDKRIKYMEVRESAAHALGELRDARAVQPLISAFADISDAAMEAVVQIGEPAVDSLIPALAYIARVAAPALARIGDGRAVEPLIRTLGSHNPASSERRVQAEIGAIAQALGEFKDPRAAEPLISLLADTHEYGKISVRSAAANALANIGTPAVKPLIAALGKGDVHEIEVKGEILAKIGAPAMDPLIASLKDENPNVRTAAASALGKFNNFCAGDELITALKDENAGVRKAAAEALGKLGDLRAINPLIEMLRNGDRDDRWSAAAALEKVGWQPGRDEDSAFYWIAFGRWEECARIGAPAVKPLAAALKDYHNERKLVVAALDKLGWQPGNDETGVIYWIFKMKWEECVRIGAPAVDLLIAKLGFTVEYPQYSQLPAAEALGKIGDARAVEPLIATFMYEKNSSDVRRAAADALVKIGDARAVELLVAALKTVDEFTRRYAIQVLTSLYRSGRLDEASKELLLAHRDEMSMPHVDFEACGKHRDDGAVGFPL